MKQRELLVTVNSGRRKAKLPEANDQDPATFDPQLPKFNSPFFGRLSQQLKVSSLFSATSKSPNKQQLRGKEGSSSNIDSVEGGMTQSMGDALTTNFEKLVCVLDTNAVVDMSMHNRQGLSFDEMLKMVSENYDHAKVADRKSTRLNSSH